MNLQPGGWIEQVEAHITQLCDDGTLPPDSYLAKWGPMFLRARIEAASFTNVHEKTYKPPVGEWARNPILREAGKYNKAHLLERMEGYAMYLLIKFGEPEPWRPEEVQVLLAKLRKDLASGFHSYYIIRRVWTQKPLTEEVPSSE